MCGWATSTAPGRLGRTLEALLALREEGLIRHLGVSDVTAAEFAEEAVRIAPIACVQNHYNLYRRDEDPRLSPEDISELG
ncbi:aldo/keto reductase [Streptomyces sp. NPDC002793]|uniref:aldo/keto reductase n=1 Tax=Streptomyces sp. NPDC002793 TaxID=3154432 RepID=UPI003321ECBA